MKKLFLLLIISFTSQNIFSQSIKDCETCNTKILQEKQLVGKSVEELALLRNEIFARKGYKFSPSRYAQYFANQKWYVPISDNNQIKLSETESKNISTIKRLEQKEQSKRDRALKELAELKTALTQNNKPIIEQYLKKLQKDYIAQLKEVFDKLDLNNIHWNKNTGLYKQTIDNGFSISSYSILFSYDNIKISGGMNSHTEIFGDFGDGYSEYMSETESQTWWIFKLTDNGIAFDYVGDAG